MSEGLDKVATLRTGKRVLRVTLAQVIARIEVLEETTAGMLALHSLCQLAGGEISAIFPQSAELLSDLMLVYTDDSTGALSITQGIRDCIQALVRVEGFELVFTDPFGE